MGDHAAREVDVGIARRIDRHVAVHPLHGRPIGLVGRPQGRAVGGHRMWRVVLSCHFCAARGQQTKPERGSER
jgi:hypothetical protein